MSRFITGLFGTKQKSPPATALRISSSLQGQVVPLILAGRTRMAVNLIDYFNFLSQTGSGGGGKGGATGKGSGNQTTYSVSFIAAICEGPINSITGDWLNGTRNAFGHTPPSVPVYEGSFNVAGEQDDFYGEYSQQPWSITTATFGNLGQLQSNQTAQLQLLLLQNGGILPPSIVQLFQNEVQQSSRALAYRGIAYVASPNFPLGSSPSLPQFNIEVQSTNCFNIVPGLPDGDPSIAVVDFLTNKYYGLGFPAFRIAPLSGYPGSWQSYCKALGFAMSAAIASPTQASSLINDMITATNCAACWQNGMLNVVPYGDSAVAQGDLNEIAETHVVPNPNDPNNPTNIVFPVSVIQVGNVATFVADNGVSYFEGSPLQPVAYPPVSPGTYAEMGGYYYFSQFDYGQLVTISYTYAAASSYIPDTTTLYDFTIDDFLPNQGTIGTGLAAGNSPIVIVRKPRDQMNNNVKVEYLDRDNAYNPVNIEVKDQASIVTFGRIRPTDVKQFHFFALASSAVQSAALLLLREQIARTFQWTVGKHFMMIINLMKIVTLTESSMGLFREPVRIIEIQENTDESITLTAEEYSGIASAPTYGVEVTSQAPLNYNADPGPVSQPIVFEPTDELGRALISGGGLMIAVAVCGSSPLAWGGAQVWASYDNQNYTKLGTITTQARMGVLTSPLNAYPLNQVGQTVDATNTLSVDLTESGGTLIGVSQLDALSLNSRCFIGQFISGPNDSVGEVIAFQNATLIGENQYSLSYLVRGAYGTESEIRTWPAGSAFVRLDDSVFAFPFDKSRIGSSVFLKFVSFNIYGGGTESLADVPAYQYVIQGLALASPLPDVTNLRSSFTGSRLALTWDEIVDFRNGIRYEIRQGSTFPTAVSLGTFAHPPFLVPGAGTFWVTGWVQPAANLIVRSEDAVPITVSGTILLSNLVASLNCAAEHWVPGTFNNTVVDAGVNAVRTQGGDLARSDLVTSAPALTATANTITFAGTVPGLILGLEVRDLTSGSAPALQIGTTVIGIATTASPPTTTVTLSLPVQGSDWGSDFNPTDFVSRGVLPGDTIAFYPATIFGTYAPTFTVNIGRVINTAVTISFQGLGVPVGQNILAVPNILTDPDILGAASTQFVDVSAYILVSSDGVNYTRQKYTPGDYMGSSFKFEFDLTSFDLKTIAYLLSAVITVQVPTRIDHLLTNGTLPSAGTTFVFTPDGTTAPAAFNGGPNGATVPAIIATWGDEQTGDVLSITGLTNSHVTVQIKNAGAGVQRNQVSVYAEGF